MGHRVFCWLATHTATKSHAECHTSGKFLQRFPWTTYCTDVHLTNTPMTVSLMGFICENFLRVCEFTSNTFWECVCNRRCELLATHSGKYLGWFPSECLGVPMECPLPTDSPPPPDWLTDCLSLSSPERGAGQGVGNGTIHKYDPLFFQHREEQMDRQTRTFYSG